MEGIDLFPAKESLPNKLESILVVSARSGIAAAAVCDMQRIVRVVWMIAEIKKDQSKMTKINERGIGKE